MNELCERSISVSEIKRWLTCRLRWRWASAPPRGLGLTPIVPVPELQLGRVVHEALQIGYDSKRSFEEVYWELVGGRVEETEDPLELYNRENPPMRDRELGARMLRGYQDWSEEHDQNLQFLATETRGRGVELPGSEATLSYILDALVETPTGMWVLDFKTTSYTSTDWTHRDLQATVYTYVARKLFDPGVRGVIFRFLLKKEPWDYNRLLLKSGAVTKRKNLPQLTTQPEYYRAVAISALMDLSKRGFEVPGAETPDDFNEALSWAKRTEEFKQHFTAVRSLYREQLQDLDGAVDNFFWDVEEYRSEVQVHNYTQNLVVPTVNDIISPDHWIGPTGIGIYRACSRCPFEVPCKMAMDGADYETYLSENYYVSPHYSEVQDETTKDE